VCVYLIDKAQLAQNRQSRILREFRARPVASHFFNKAPLRSEPAKPDSSHSEALALESQFAGFSGQAALTMPNLLQGPSAQQYIRAQREFTEARLRRESGAAIPESEFATDRKTYFIQPGDRPDTIVRKQLARARLLQNMAFQSGPAWRELMGRPFNPADYQPATEQIGAGVGGGHVGRFRVDMVQ